MPGVAFVVMQFYSQIELSFLFLFAVGCKSLVVLFVCIAAPAEETDYGWIFDNLSCTAVFFVCLPFLND